MLRLFRSWIVILILISGSAGTALAFRCSGRIISEGMKKPEVLHLCGEPDWRDTFQIEKFARYSHDDWHKTYTSVEDWLYNPGPTGLIRILRFEDSELERIRTAGYGYIENTRAGQSLDLNEVSEGDTKPEVIADWGPPDETDTYMEERIFRKYRGKVMTVQIQVSDWTYNPGPTGLLRHLRFENGKLTDIETGERGY